MKGSLVTGSNNGENVLHGVSLLFMTGGKMTIGSTGGIIYLLCLFGIYY